MQFDLATNHLIFYILHQLAEGYKDPIDNHEIHATLFEALQASGSKSHVGFVSRWCDEYFPNGYEKCFGFLQTVFEPKKGDYPPFFDPKKVKKIEVPDTSNVETAYAELPNFWTDITRILTQYETGNHEDGEDDDLVTIPELGTYAIFKSGVVVVQQNATWVFYVNRASQYIGVLRVTDKVDDCKMSYVR